VRGLIVKVPHSHRWHVSGKGHQVLGAVVRLYHYVRTDNASLMFNRQRIA